LTKHIRGKAPPAGNPSRRDLVKSMAALATAAGLPLPAVAAVPSPIDEFLIVSSKLSGIALDKSYSQMAETIYTIFHLERRADLHALMRFVIDTPEDRIEHGLKSTPFTKTVQDILTAWYTGSIPLSAKLLADPAIQHLSGKLVPAANGKPTAWVFAYDEALAWRACTFTKPSAACGGTFGYWQDPPV
jgi:hypothetical protein